MKDSKIEWCDHTFNPWRGCTKVSPGCANCYAETLSKRNPAVLGMWGPRQLRVRASEAIWRQPKVWNEHLICSLCSRLVYHGNEGAMCNGGSIFGCLGTLRRQRVFCASLSDWLDDEVPIEWLADLLTLIQQTPNLDWLLLTKRPQLWRERLEEAYRVTRGWMFEPETGAMVDCWLHENVPPHNVWFGVTVENQVRANERLPLLLSIPAEKRFLSCEPLLGFIDLYYVLKTCWRMPAGYSNWRKAPYSQVEWHRQALVLAGWKPGVDWVIAGGESGPGARPMHPDWARCIRDQCAAVSVPFLFKQWGEYLPQDQQDAHGLEWVTGHSDPRNHDWEPGGFASIRVGKKAAGRFLDGIEHNAFPPIPV